MDNKKGSNWNRWDLHIHSPKTNLNSKYNCDIEQFCKTIKEKELSVIGLTNYFILHEAEYAEVAEKLGNDALVIPNIEFRTNDKNGDNEFINIHVLFNPETTKIKQINEWLSRIKLNNIASQTSIYCTKEELGKIGYENVTVSLDQLIDQLKADFTPKDYIIAGVPNGYGGFHPDRKPRNIELAKKIDELSNIMLGRAEDREFFLSRDNERGKLGFKLKPIFVCSDSHTIGDIGTKSTWVKSEPSFEGLKQTLIEPKYRLDCNENIKKPYRFIDNVKFDFPTNTQLKNSQTNSLQPFCLTDLKQEINFSPYFTCFIGGRGAGKSTIINIIAEALGEKTEFFKNNKIIVEGNEDVLKNNANDFIKIEGTNEIEFISQGMVEVLSQGSYLTTIFNERIKSVGSEYTEKEKELENRFSSINENISIIKDLSKHSSELKIKQSSLENDKKIIASIENENYKALSSAVNRLSNNITSLQTNKSNYNLLLNDLVNLLKKYDIRENSDEYSNRISEIKSYIESLDEIEIEENKYSVTLKEFSTTNKTIKDSQIELANLKQQIVDYFTSIGTTQDSIADVDRATSNIAHLENEISKLIVLIQTKQEQLDKNTAIISDLEKLANDCKLIIDERLKKINNDLDIENENVEKIKFAFEFDNEKFELRLFSEFYEQFKSFHKPNLSWDNIYWCLRLVKPDNNFLKLSYAEFWENKKLKTIDYNALYGKVFYEIFSIESNFEIYKLLIAKHFYNISNTIEIIGFYGKSPLTSCSFGQRCTAVVITLLMTGMKPLLIDEPEAHLDNKLIAEYLVDLLKEKKNERQIIFASHNANFVINGDAELIHILDIPKGKIFTEIVSTTIENLTNRTNLLKLEGGEEAFRKRDQKLLASYAKTV